MVSFYGSAMLRKNFYLIIGFYNDDTAALVFIKWHTTVNTFASPFCAYYGSIFIQFHFYRMAPDGIQFVFI